MSTITLKLSGGLAARLRSAVKRRGKSQSVLMREALEAHLEQDGEAASGSCLDLAHDLAGSLNGPSDLSSARKHLRGYGR